MAKDNKKSPTKVELELRGDSILRINEKYPLFNKHISKGLGSFINHIDNAVEFESKAELIQEKINKIKETASNTEGVIAKTDLKKFSNDVEKITSAKYKISVFTEDHEKVSEVMENLSESDTFSPDDLVPFYKHGIITRKSE